MLTGMFNLLQKHTNSMRLSVVHNPSGDIKDNKDMFIARAIQVALETLSTTMAKSFVTKLLKEENVESLAKGAKMLEELAVNVSLSELFLYY